MAEKASGRKWIEIAVFVALWAAFLAYGLWLRRQIPFESDLRGFDYRTHGRLFADGRSMLGFLRFRHPLFGLLMFPVAIFGQSIARESTAAFWAYLCAIFSAVATACVWFVWRICAAVCGPGARWRAATCAAAFASFAYVRILAACPESFAVSMLVFLATVAWGMRDRTAEGMLPGTPRERRMVDFAAWGASFVVASGVTLTQGAKVLLAFLATHRLTRREWRKAFAWTGAALAALALAYWVKIRFFGGIGQLVTGEIESDIEWLKLSDFTLRERLVAMEMFFFEPIISHGAPYGEATITTPYKSLLPYLACFGLYAVAVFGAWRLRHSRLFRMLAAGLAVDFALHLVVSWGLHEGQIYCGHWFFAIPIFLAGAIAPKGARMP